jgi:hypothetical protein
MRWRKRAQAETADCALSSESFVPKGTVRLSVLVVKVIPLILGKR